MEMALSEAVRGLSIKADENLEQGSCIDEILTDQRPRKQQHKTPGILKQELEETFLNPPGSFSSEWLNTVQQVSADIGCGRWDLQTDYADLYEPAPTQTRTVIRFTREGLEGKVTGYREVTVPANSSTAKNSTSFLRKPANRADFVRGAAGFLPFAPAGLEGIQEIAALEDDIILDAQSIHPFKRSLDRVIEFGSGLLQTPPGFTRGFNSGKTIFTDNDDVSKEVEETLGEAPDNMLSENHTTLKSSSRIAGDTDESGPEAPDEGGDEDIDSLLPVEFPAFEPRGPLATSTNRRVGKEWAHMVDVNRDITNFRDLVPDMARSWPFELDTFQKEAVYHLENGDSVFVAAHTSAGKTVVAEYAIALAAKHMTKTIYTSPIKALSNQKFRDFRLEFDDVGILTGDVQINPEASCLIMTTEILRSMLYRGADLLRDVEFVIFDEVHYVNDLERGVVWEEVIIMLPEHVTLILLSATVPNTYEFASWVGRTKRKDIYVISTPKRPVPLEHYLWADKAMYKIVDAEKRFLDKGWIAANAAIAGRHDKPATGDHRSDVNGRGNRGQSNRTGPPRGNHRGGSQQRGRGQPQKSTGNITRTGRGGGRISAAQDKHIWVHLVQQLKRQALLPACIFVFSKKRCEENADALSNVDFCTAAEKSNIHMIIERSLARLKLEDRTLPQIRRLRELLSRGIAVHHGGLLPIVKEVVEILFAKSLIKVLFATETFAMGLNLPTRTVAFSGFRKHDGRSFRDLLPGEYTQMAGRAGRRGLDPVGTVIIVASGSDEAPPVYALKRMMLGDPTRLRSQFRLTYNMILNLLRVEALKIEEMIKRSFSENATQALLPEQEKQVKLSEVDLAKIKREPCNICDVDLNACHAATIAYQSSNLKLHFGLLASPVGRRMITANRLIVFHKDGIRMPGILLPHSVSRGPAPTLKVLSLGSKNSTRQPSDLLPYIKNFRSYFTALVNKSDEMELRVFHIPLGDVDCITKTVAKIDFDHLDQLIRSGEIKTQLADLEISKIFISWNATYWDEFDWGRVKELSILDILEKRKEDSIIAQNTYCVECPNFVKHFSMCHDEWLLKENISQLKQLMSDQNLQLLPDYEQRIAVLTDLGFVDENARVELKGKVACEIHSADELVLTELILENVLATYEPEEIVALLSAFVFQEKTDVVPNLTGRLEKGKKTIIKISEKVNNIQTKHQVILSSDDSNDFISRPRFGLCEVVYEWARGMSFNCITDLTDVLEGTIVRVITRLDETCREVKNAARIIGDPELFTKMQSGQEMIKRDITAVASLYM